MKWNLIIYRVSLYMRNRLNKGTLSHSLFFFDPWRSLNCKVNQVRHEDTASVISLLINWRLWLRRKVDGLWDKLGQMRGYWPIYCVCWPNKTNPSHYPFLHVEFKKKIIFSLNKPLNHALACKKNTWQTSLVYWIHCYSQVHVPVHQLHKRITGEIYLFIQEMKVAFEHLCIFLDSIIQPSLTF